MLVSRDRLPHPGDQAGFGLIEVVISAAILFLVTVGTLSLMDGASRTTTESRSRSVAADLAEQDQEQLRATAAVTLGGDAATGRQGFSNPRSVTVAGVSYDIVSKAEWLRDSTGATPSCTDADGIAEYLKLTSSVQATNNSAGIAPVTITSLLTPTAGSFGKHTGTLTVQLKDRASAGVLGVPVTVSGPMAATQSTNAAGCAIFNYFNKGTYTATWTKSGFVDLDGNVTPIASATVTDNNTTRVARQYDVAGGLVLNVKTRSGAASTASEVTIANPKMTASRIFPEAGPLATPAASISTGLRLFPFADGYSAYTGDCAANSPSGYPGEPLATIAALNRGAAPALDVYQPTLSVTLKKSGAALANGRILLTPSAADQALGCTTKYAFIANAAGVVSAGLPFGHYTVCVDDRSSRKWSNGAVYDNVDVDTLFTPAAAAVNIPSTGYQSGTCS